MDRLDIEVKFSTDDAGLISGYASVFGGEPDTFGDLIAKGAFANSLATHRKAGTSPLFLWQHDRDEPIGAWIELVEDNAGLAVTGRIILGTQRGKEAYALLKGGALNGLSIGYRTRASQRLAGGGRILTELELIEISLVSVPAASRARVTSVKAAHADPPAAMGAANMRSQDMAKQDQAPAREAGNEGDNDNSADDRVASIETKMAGADTRLAAVEESVGNVVKLTERIEQKLNRPGVGDETKTEDIERKAFTGFLRHGREALPVDEVKSLRVADDTAGGYLAPDDFVKEVIKGIVEVSPVRQAARVGSTASGSVILPKRTGTPTAKWVGENEESSETGAAYGQAEIPVHEMSCYVDVSLRLLEDAAVNVEGEVAFDLAEEFGRLEGNALVVGDGVKKPEGFLVDTGVAYTPSGTAATLGANPEDNLITVMYALPAFYRNSGTWMMNGGTLAVIRKLKDSNGAFLWQPSLQAGQPETLLGRPVVETPDMPDIAADAEPIAFGNFSRAFRIYDRVALSVMRDPYTQATKGLVRFHARRRVGAGVVLAEAIRKLKCAVS